MISSQNFSLSLFLFCWGKSCLLISVYLFDSKWAQEYDKILLSFIKNKQCHNTACGCLCYCVLFIMFIAFQYPGRTNHTPWIIKNCNWTAKAGRIEEKIIFQWARKYKFLNSTMTTIIIISFIFQYILFDNMLSESWTTHFLNKMENFVQTLK